MVVKFGDETAYSCIEFVSETFPVFLCVGLLPDRYKCSSVNKMNK